MNGEAMLRQAARVVGQRRRAYGDPAASMAAVAARWSITLGQPVTAAQVVLCLIDLKVARLGHEPAHAKSILDVAGYARCSRRCGHERDEERRSSDHFSLAFVW